MRRSGSAFLPRPPGRRHALLCGVALGALAAAGCGTFLPSGSRTYYELRDLAPERSSTPAPPGDAAGRGLVMLVSVHQSSTLYESTGIVFTRDDGGRAYYQLASWSERPTRRLGLIVQRRLAQSAAAGEIGLADVALDTSGVRGDWLLGLRLADLYHETTTQPDRAVLTVEVDLLDWNERRMLDRAVFSATVDLAAENADSAVAAMNRAMTTVLDRIEAWVGERARAAPATRGTNGAA
jgi:ABC-type uncharacterized transport system auxiliary subunit